METAYTQAVDISVSRVTYPYAVHFIRLTEPIRCTEKYRQRAKLSFSLQKLVTLRGVEPRFTG